MGNFYYENCWSASTQVRVRRLPKTRFNSENLLTVKRSGRTTVSVWDGFWLGGVTSPLYRVRNHLRSIQYVDNILEGVLLPYITENFVPEMLPVHFVQDK